MPNNAGVYRCITVTAPKGSILNPELPAAVAARALTGYRVVDTVMGALGADRAGSRGRRRRRRQHGDRASAAMMP